MNKKLISGIILILIGIFLPISSLLQYPDLLSCHTVAIPASFIWSCAFVNLVPTVIIFIIGMVFILRRNK